MKKYVRICIYLCLYAVLIGMFIYLGKKDYGNHVVKYSDNEKFNQDYPEIPVDNNFNYINANDVVNLLNNGTGVIYIGFASNEWSQYYVKYMYEALKEKNLDNIYYYDSVKDKSRQSKSYNEIINILKDYLYRNDDDKVDIETPCLIFVKNGVITFFDDETAITRTNMKPSDYWSEDQIATFEAKINSYMDGEDYNG